MRDFSGLASTEVFTLHDLVHRMTLRTMGDASERNQALYVRALQDAIRGMPGKHDWSYYKRQTRFTTSPPVDATIDYDHTGGAAERLVTITSADTWPTDASYGELLVGDQYYRIHERLSDTTATLESDFNPGEDLSEETATWERRSYTLSREATRIHYVQNVTANRYIPYLPTSEFLSSSYSRWGHGVSTRFTWQNHGNMFGGSEIILLPASSLAETFEVSATVNPHIPRINAVGGPDAATTSGSTTVTATEASFGQELVGSIFRLGRTSNPPTNYQADKWDFQAFITEVTNGTTLKLSEPAPSTTTGRGYIISSPIDIETSTMLECVEDAAFAQYTKNHDHKSAKDAMQIAATSCRLAIARDNKVSLNSRLWTNPGVTPWEIGGLYVVEATE